VAVAEVFSNAPRTRRIVLVASWLDGSVTTSGPVVATCLAMRRKM
jgi:hypothetical protein